MPAVQPYINRCHAYLVRPIATNKGVSASGATMRKSNRGNTSNSSTAERIDSSVWKTISRLCGGQSLSALGIAPDRVFADPIRHIRAAHKGSAKHHLEADR